MLVLKATVNFVDPRTIGFEQTVINSGVQPSFNIDSELIMSKVISLDGLEFMSYGKDYNVKIELAYGEKYIKLIKLSNQYKLQFGGRVLGIAIVTAIDTN